MNADRAPSRVIFATKVGFVHKDDPRCAGAPIAPEDCLTCWARMPCTQHSPTYRNP